MIISNDNIAVTSAAPIAPLVLHNIIQPFLVVFGLADEYESYYFGKVVCPANYPARSPYITIMMNNGDFEPNEKICLSITDYHPESWNPAWTVTHIVKSCVSFYMQDEETSGSLYYFEKDDKS
jgi:ubiquitin-conjugating enzyme E2 J2